MGGAPHGRAILDIVDIERETELDMAFHDAITAAAHFTPLLDWVDLDGAALLKHDPFTGASIAGHQVTALSACCPGSINRTR